MVEKGIEKLLSEADRSKLSTTGGNPEAWLCVAVQGPDFDAQQILMPNRAYGSYRKTKHMPPKGFQKFLIHKVQDRRWPWTEMAPGSPLRTTGLSWDQRPSQPSESPVLTPGCPAKTMSRQTAYMHIIFVLIKS